MTKDINVLALVKGKERYIFLFDDENRAEALRGFVLRHPLVGLPNPLHELLHLPDHLLVLLSFRGLRPGVRAARLLLSRPGSLPGSGAGLLPATLLRRERRGGGEHRQGQKAQCRFRVHCHCLRLDIRFTLHYYIGI